MNEPDLSLAKLANQEWRLNNLYYITDKKGRRVLFKPNAAQTEFMRNMHFRNVILKARQLGFSTFIDIYMLDIALWYPNTNCGLIAHTLKDALKLFQNKIKYPYENLPLAIKSMVQIVKSNETELTFSNNSSISVGTSLRGSTLNYLHISEFGKIAAQRPDIADEIVTGALPTVASGNFVFVESTAEGAEGRFADMVKKARSLANRGKALSPLDFKFFFFPWYLDPTYVLNADAVDIPPEADRYFTSLATDHDIHLTPEQKAWWVSNADILKDAMLREYPADPDEAFRASIDGQPFYFAAQLSALEKQGRVSNVPYNPRYDVEVWADLGINDKTVLIFVQRTATAIHIIDCYASSDKTIADYAVILRNKAMENGWKYSRFVMPHDIMHRDISGDGRDRKAIAESCGIRPIVVAPKLDVITGIDEARNLLKTCYFDEKNTDQLFKALSKYRKDWNNKTGVWSDRPRHDDSSHYADALRYGAVTPPPEDVGFDRLFKVRRFGAV